MVVNKILKKRIPGIFVPFANHLINENLTYLDICTLNKKFKKLNTKK